ncbi:hypothetical protein PAERUG_P53_London_9_VIM_2_02_13_03784 [Pseudomonas aeruginosa]|nr:hypothetical protein PAERUG_P53_London_9_VIM_2_02_13_03784 [Pseudomonas aeruginosa]
MVVVGMAQQQAVQAPQVQAPQHRHHHPLAHVERPLPRTAVIEQDMLSGTHQHGQPLADVQHPHFRPPPFDRRR